MRWTRFVIACVVVGAGAVAAASFATAQATRPASANPGAQAVQPATTASSDPASVAKQLSSPEWRERRTARETLVRLGDDAVPTLQSLVQSAPDEEARHQAQEALAQIELNRTLGPSYITLHVKDARPEEVFAEIARQCHAPLTTYPDNLWSQGNFPALTMDVDRKPFWEIVPGICQHFGVDFRQYQTSLRIMRTGLNQLLGVSEVDGPFLVVADRISYTRTRVLGGARGETTAFSMNLSLYPEPKITMLHGISSLKLIEAVDDHGNSLLPPPASRTISSGGFSAGAAQLFAPLQYPRRNPGAKITRFRADATFNVQTRSQQVQIPDILKVKDYHVSLRSMEFTVKDLTAKDGGYEMRLSIIPSPTAPPEFRNIFDQVQNNLRLLDARGSELPHRGISSSPSNDALDINLMFANTTPAHPPDKLLWDVPVEARQITVPIHFTDIPLFDN
jgi:hypothetical protein